MTREELERAVIRDIINGATHWVAPEAVASSVIRLVVEACAAEVELFLRTDKYAWPPNIPGLLRSTFLPPKDPSNG